MHVCTRKASKLVADPVEGAGAPTCPILGGRWPLTTTAQAAGAASGKTTHQLRAGCLCGTALDPSTSTTACSVNHHEESRHRRTLPTMAGGHRATRPCHACTAIDARSYQSGTLPHGSTTRRRRPDRMPLPGLDAHRLPQDRVGVAGNRTNRTTRPEE